MSKKLDFQALLDIQVNLSGKEQVDRMIEQLGGIDSAMRNVSVKRSEEARKLGERMQAEVKTDQEVAAMNPQQRLEYERKMNALKTEYFSLINKISTAEIKNLANTQELKDELELVNKEYRTAQSNVTNLNKELSRLVVQSKEAKEAILGSTSATASATGFSESQINTPRKVQNRINSMSGDPANAEKIEALEKHKEVLLQNNKIIAQTEAALERVNVKLDEGYEVLEKKRINRLQVNKKILDAAEAEQRINDETRDSLDTLIEVRRTNEEITDEKEKQAAAQKTGEVEKNIKDAKRLANSNEQVRKSFLGKITAATIYYASLRALRKLISSVIKTVRELDKSVTEVAMVTNLNRQQTWQLVGAYQALAHEVGATTDEIARLSVYFFRQGRAAEDALELTRVAAIAAKVAAIDMTESANFLTSAINGFGMAADQAMSVSDKFAALGASSASSYQEMAIALSKVAPVAKTAGVGIDFMMGVLAKGIETTREAPENIGTAFKTVFARMTQIREFGATLDDATGVNKVEEALKQANVSLRDSTGQFRNMDDVLTELGYAFDGLTRNQQAYIATALAGTRQQSRLLAVMQNFDRTMELVNISTMSSGATMAQHAEYAGGMEAATARLTNSWEKLILAFSNTEIIINIIDALSNAISFLADEVKKNSTLLLISAGIMTTALVTSLVLVKIAAYKAATALAVKAGALTAATGGLNLLIPAIAALVTGGLYLFLRKSTTEADKLRMASEKLSEDIKQNQVDIYNYRKSRLEITQLRDRYVELQNQVIKSAEEMQEMNDLGDKLKNILEDEYDLVVKGNLDEDAERIIAHLERQEAAGQKTEIESGQEKLDDYIAGVVDKLDPSDMQAVSKFIADSLFGNFTDASIKDQEHMLDIALANFESFAKDYGIASGIFERGNKGLEDLISFREEFDNITDMTVTAGKQSKMADFFGDLFSSEEEMLSSAAEGLGISYDEIFGRSYADMMTGLENYFTKTQTQGEGLLQSTALNKNLVDLRQGFDDLFSNNLSEKEQTNLWKNFFGLDERNQQALANSFTDLGNLYGLGLDTLTTIVDSKMTNAQGQLLSIGEKMSITKALSNAGLNADTIGSYFTRTGKLTADSIGSFLSDIEGKIGDNEYQQLSADLFGIFTDDMTVQKFFNNTEKMKTSVQNLLGLMEKYKTEGLNAEEWATVQESLLNTDMLDDFMAGTLTAEQFMGTQIEKTRVGLAALIAAQREKIGDAQEPFTKQILENELLLMENLYSNLEEMIYDNGMSEVYESQINYIQQINEELQREVDLQEQKLDMNRSMLSLNRQIRALESDTSYGAQARLEDLRMTREQEGINRQKFIMDQVANQQIGELQDKIQNGILSNTAATALGIDELISIFSGSSNDYNKIQAQTGTKISRGNRGSTGKVLAVESP